MSGLSNPPVTAEPSDVLHPDVRAHEVRGDWLALCPPLAVAELEVKEIVTRMWRVVERTYEWVGAEGLD